MVWHFKALPRPDALATSVQTGFKMFLLQYIIELNHYKPLCLNIEHYKEKSLSKIYNIVHYFCTKSLIFINMQIT